MGIKLDITKTERYLREFFASSRWYPHPGEKVKKIQVHSDIICVTFESEAALLVSEREISIVAHYASEDFKSYPTYEYKGYIRSPEEALEQSLIAIKNWCDGRHKFYDECLKSFEDTGASREEAMRLNAVVFGRYRGYYDRNGNLTS